MLTTTPCDRNRRNALFTAVYTAKRNNVLAFARSMAETPRLRSQSDDVTQTVFLRFQQCLVRGGFSEVTCDNWHESGQHLRLQAWLFSATVLVTREFSRQSRKESSTSLEMLGGESLPSDDSDLTPLQKLLLQEARDTCSAAEQAVIDLTLHGYTSREIAEYFGTLPSTVRGRWMAARRRMRSFLESDPKLATSSLLR